MATKEAHQVVVTEVHKFVVNTDMSARVLQAALQALAEDGGGDYGIYELYDDSAEYTVEVS